MTRRPTIFMSLAGIWVMAICVPSAKAAKVVSARLLADVAGIQPGRKFTVGVVLVAEPGWHIYWKNPGDAGLPTEVKVHLPDGFSAGPVLYPTPQRFFQPGGIIAYGYEGEVMLLVEVTPPKVLGPAPIEIGTDISWLSCKKVCRPGDAKLSINLPVVEHATPANQDRFDQARRLVPTEAAANGGTVTTRSEGDGVIVEMILSWRKPPAHVDFIPGPADSVEIKDVSVETGSGGATRMKFLARPLAGQKITDSTMEALISFWEDDSTHPQGLLFTIPLTSRK